MIRRSMLVPAVCAILFGTASTAPCGHAEAVSTADSVRYEVLVHPETGIELPRIILPERPDVEAAVNHALDSLSITMQCKTDDLPDNDALDFYEAFSEVTLASDDIFSVHVRASYFCGGPYPTNGANLSKLVQQPSPNPASYTAQFVVDIDGTAPVTVEVYDVLGRRAMQHATHLYGTGQQRIELDVSGLSAGVYVVRVGAGSIVESVLITVAR